MFCPNCGTQVQDGATFCPGCGTRLGSSTTPSYQSPATPAVRSPQPATLTHDPCPQCGSSDVVWERWDVNLRRDMSHNTKAFLTLMASNVFLFVCYIIHALISSHIGGHVVFYLLLFVFALWLFFFYSLYISHKAQQIAGPISKNNTISNAHSKMYKCSKTFTIDVGTCKRCGKRFTKAPLPFNMGSIGNNIAAAQFEWAL